jgi:hypothetical protein
MTTDIFKGCGREYVKGRKIKDMYVCLRYVIQKTGSTGTGYNFCHLQVRPPGSKQDMTRISKNANQKCRERKEKGRKYN